MVTKPEAGQQHWAEPLNAALDDLQGQIDTVSGDVATLQGAYVFARKTADESVTNSTAFQDDDQLLVPVVSGGVYKVEGFFVYNTPSAAGIKLQLTGPVGVGLWGFTGLSNSGGTVDTGSIRMSASTNGVGSSRLGGASNDIFAVVSGTFLPTASGSLVFQWAQNTANATPTVVRANSWLSVQKVA